MNTGGSSISERSSSLSLSFSVTLCCINSAPFKLAPPPGDGSDLYLPLISPRIPTVLGDSGRRTGAASTPKTYVVKNQVNLENGDCSESDASASAT